MPPVEILGAEQLAASCTGIPAPVSAEDVQALHEAMPDPRDREHHFWVPRDQEHRRYELCEKSRADDLARVIAAHNQAVSER